MDNQFTEIVSILKEKARLKQEIFRNTQAIHGRMRELTRKLCADLGRELEGLDPKVPIEFNDSSEFEFSARFSVDLLQFGMHTNVVTLSPDHILFGNPYIMEDVNRTYFGQVLVYNFTADSIRYNRQTDQGYLLARFLINKENHFFIESLGQFGMEYFDISKNVVNDEALLAFVNGNILAAIQTDLQAAPYHDLQVITLEEKEANRMPGAIEKVGFQMAHDHREHGE